MTFIVSGNGVQEHLSPSPSWFWVERGMSEVINKYLRIIKLWNRSETIVVSARALARRME